MEAAIVALIRGDAAIGALIGVSAAARIHPHIAPQGTTVPFLTYYKVSGDSTPVHSLSNRRANLEWSRLTIEAWSQTYAQAKDIDDKVRILLDGFSGVSASLTLKSVKRIATRDLFEPDAIPKPLYRVSSDYLINYPL